MSVQNMPAVRLHNISRNFDGVRAVDNVSLDVAEGEFFAMLGPSGSGKTTCLRLIGGFERPDVGQISIFGQQSENLPAYRRPVNTVFQDYALFPHMNVLENVSYGLLLKGVNRPEREKRAREALEMMRLSGTEKRRIGQLSGGQRQRMALARALVNKPKVLLLDEPLGALDLKLREQMQEELKTLQQSLKITFIFVTHDQTEALSLADRVAVFNEGKVVQVGTPEEVYRAPRNKFVASFVGSSNLLPPSSPHAGNVQKNWASIRPERIQLLADGTAPPNGSTTVNAVITNIQYHGRTKLISARAGDVKIRADLPAEEAGHEVGHTVRMNWRPADVVTLEDIS